MTDKEVFIERMKSKTKKFAVDVIKFCDSLKIVRHHLLSSINLSNLQHQLGLITGHRAKQDQKGIFLAKLVLL